MVEYVELDEDEDGIIDPSFLPATATKAQAEASTSTTVYSWSPIRIWQAIAKWATDTLGSMSLVDKPAADSKQYAFKDNAWAEVVAGDVTGPATSTAGNLPVLDSTGKILSDSGTKPADFLTVEVDPVFSSSPAFGITSEDITGWDALVSFPGFTDLSTDYAFTDNSADWDAAYGWGDHSTVGYLTAETDPVFSSSAAAGITATDISNWDALVSFPGFGTTNTTAAYGDHTHDNTSPTFSAVEATTITFASEYDNGNSGSSKTINWSTGGNVQKVTLTGDCTFTFTAPSGPAQLVLKLIMDGTLRDPVWPATVLWGSAGEPTFSSTSGNWDIVSFYFDGTNYSASRTHANIGS